MRDLAARQTLFPLLCLAAPLRTGCPTLLLRMDFRQVFRMRHPSGVLLILFPALYSSPSTGGCSFGVFQITVCLRTTCTYSPYLSLSRRVPTAPPTRNGNFHSGYSRLTVNLRSAGHLFSLLILLRGPFPGMAASVMPIPAWLSDEAHTKSSARSNHRAPFFHHAGISSARSYVPISSGPMVESLSNLERIGKHWTPQLCPGLPAAPRR